MDRPLEPALIKRQTRKRILQVCLVLAAIAVGFFLLSALIAPSVNRSSVRTAVVERGPIMATLSAFGTVVPAFEQSLSSPSETRVIAVLAQPGTNLKKGQPILELDLNETKLAREQVEKNLSLKENSRNQVKLDMNRILSDLAGQRKIKSLRLEYLQSKLSQQQRLFELGAVSKDQLEQAKLDEETAAVERQQLDSTITSTSKSLENQLSGLETEIQTLRRERMNRVNDLDMLSCRATRDGILTWVNQTLGATIHKGDIVARIADLSDYRIEAMTSDVHAQQIRTGLPVQVDAGGRRLDGTISAVFPSVEAGSMKFQITLTEKAGALLRPNLRVDVFVVTENKREALRVKNGPFINGNGPQDVYVVRNGKAYRTAATIGAMSFDFVEILSGLEENDEVIISDMKSFSGVKELTLK